MNRRTLSYLLGTLSIATSVAFAQGRPETTQALAQATQQVRHWWAGIFEGMTPPAWSALVSAAALVATICFQIIAWRRDRFSRGIAAITALEERFEDKEFRERRRDAARHLLTKNADDIGGKEAIYCVLNLFETLGFLYEKRVVDADTVWHFFGTWLLPYFAGAKFLIDKECKIDPSLYSDTAKLYVAVCKVEKEKHPSRTTTHITSDAAVASFLRGEAILGPTASPSTAPP